jgi:hypothetical protein
VKGAGLLEAHETILTHCHEDAAKVIEQGNDGANDLLWSPMSSGPVNCSPGSLPITLWTPPLVRANQPAAM